MEKLDILQRDEFVTKLLNMLECISENEASTCFAINGVWGCGKSFVLDMLQEQLETDYSEKFWVMRYNCWKYDYYEEPLIALVSVIMASIEEKTQLFPDGEEKRKILGVLKAVGVSLLSIGADAMKAKTGLDLPKAYETIQKGQAEGAAEYEDDHDYDVYFGFNKVLNELSDLLQSLTEQYTIVLLVDELDRCLPEYSVKILERLHHLAEGQKNIITVISIDKKQLTSNVKQIFGFDNPEKYLEKFINFEVKLDCGKVSTTIYEKYKDYIELFDKNIFEFDEPIEECLQALFKGVDIRTQEQIMKKVTIVHKLLYSEAKDYSFMCMEILIAVMICAYGDASCFTDVPVDMDSWENVFNVRRNNENPAFNNFFKEKFEKIRFSREMVFPREAQSLVLPERPSLYGAILFSWYWMHKRSDSHVIQYVKNSPYESIAKNHKELKKYAEMISLMS